MISRLALAFLLATTCSLLSAGKAQAQCGSFAGGGYGNGFFDIGRLYQVLADNVPYYSAFPPVYYSAPVPRTYGYSPFAYPPRVMTPEVAEVVPQEILNPHMPASTEAPIEDSDTVTQVDQGQVPLSIVNPYVTTRLAENFAH